MYLFCTTTVVALSIYHVFSLSNALHSFKSDCRQLHDEVNWFAIREGTLVIATFA